MCSIVMKMHQNSKKSKSVCFDAMTLFLSIFFLAISRMMHSSGVLTCRAIVVLFLSLISYVFFTFQMKMIVGLLLCILYVPYVSMEMLTAHSSAPSSEFVETFEKRCPPGLWCGRKRGIPEQQAMISGDKGQHADVDAFEKRCPPGLWCGKKRSFSGKTNTHTKEDKENLVSTFEKRCPPGLWCGKKRSVPQEISIAADQNSETAMDTFEKRCPPGLWCGKKRGLSEKNMMKTFEKRCPPGLWCGKKRQVNENKATEEAEENNMAEQLEKRCPPGLWCGKRELSNQKSNNAAQIEDDSSHSLMKEFEKRCPPGLWCGKKRETLEAKEESDDSPMKDDPEVLSSMKSQAEGPIKQGPLTDVFEKRCPPGLWCGRKRAITEESAAEEEEKDEGSSLEAFEKRCPPGLWCGKK